MRDPFHDSGLCLSAPVLCRQGAGHDGGDEERVGFAPCRMGETGRKDQEIPCPYGNLPPAGILSQYWQKDVHGMESNLWRIREEKFEDFMAISKCYEIC